MKPKTIPTTDNSFPLPDELLKPVQLKVCIYDTDNHLEQELTPSEFKLSQIPNQPKQFVMSLMLPGWTHNPFTTFQTDQTYVISYYHKDLTLHFRANYKGFNLCTRLDKGKGIHETNLVFAAVLQT